MAGSSKKFNVWIVYSDIFSNLTMFVFVSAFGMFAALGAPDDPGLPSVSGISCQETENVIRSAMSAPLDSDTSFFQLYQPDTDGRNTGKCKVAFRVSDHQYPPSAQDLASLISSTGGGRRRHPVPKDWHVTTMDSICTPIWMTATRQLLKNYNGRITITATADESIEKQCSPEKQKDYLKNITPFAFHLNGEEKLISMKDYLGCKIFKRQGSFVAEKNKSALCSQISNCLNLPRPPAGQCGRVVDFQESYDWSRRACLSTLASNRAQNLYQYCEVAATDRGFDRDLLTTNLPNGKKDGETIFENNKFHYGAASDAWRKRVQSIGHTVDASDDSKLPGNAIVVEVELFPAPK